MRKLVDMGGRVAEASSISDEALAQFIEAFVRRHTGISGHDWNARDIAAEVARRLRSAKDRP